MAQRRIPSVRPLRQSGGISTLPKTPRFRVERRIKMPPVPKRPLRFQARSLLRTEMLQQKDTYWFTLHRRGPKRTWVGENQLEARAVPHSLVAGTLPERILWKYLVDTIRLVPGIDFVFQSSLQGGRIDTGGIVADFIFPYLMMVIQVQGPTHREFLRIQKDNEQRLALEEMGYQVYDVWEDEIYDEYRFEERMRRIFNWYHSGGSDSVTNFDEVPMSDGFAYDKLYASVLGLRELI